MFIDKVQPNALHHCLKFRYQIMIKDFLQFVYALVIVGNNFITYYVQCYVVLMYCTNTAVKDALYWLLTAYDVYAINKTSKLLREFKFEQVR